MEAGKEEGFSAGHAAGKVAGAIEGRDNYLKSNDFSARIKEARIQDARDFMKAPTFESALEIKAADYLMQGFDRCKRQVTTLGGFAPGFDVSQLDPSLDGRFQPFADEEVPLPTEDEFATLLDKIEED
ncbi:UNVERIFIED_CONTAM: hypothetical protein Sindi_1286400 [Sesamum indicum]